MVCYYRLMPIKSEDEAQAMLQKLHAWYRQPCLPVSKYCDALQTWSERYLEIQGEHAETLEERLEKAREVEQWLIRFRIDIRKSNLLYRLIYLGESLRQRPCPVHHGRWYGLHPDTCPHDCGHTGWLPNEEEP